MRKVAPLLCSIVLTIVVFAVAQDSNPSTGSAGQSAGGTSQSMGSSSSTMNSGSSQQAIEQLEKQSAEAASRNDPSYNQQYLADDYVRIYPDGSMGTRQQALDEMKSGTMKFSSVEVTNRKVRVYGDSAVSTGKATVKGTRNSQPIDGTYAFTRVWVKQNGQWKIAAFQSTKIGGM